MYRKGLLADCDWRSTTMVADFVRLSHFGPCSIFLLVCLLLLMLLLVVLLMLLLICERAFAFAVAVAVAHRALRLL